jgi:hypothetical protein
MMTVLLRLLKKKYGEFSKTMQGRLTMTEGRGYPLVMRKEKKEKKEIPLNTTEEITLKKKTPYPSPIPLNKTPLCFKFIRTPHLKPYPLRDGKSF